MSKREGHPNNPGDAHQTKKPKLDDEPPVNPEQFENVAPQQRPNSPVAGPSSASSDPELLRNSPQTGLIPINHYFNPTGQEGSSQSTLFTDMEFGAGISSNTTSSTNVEVGDFVEDMEVDSDASESSTSTDYQDPRYRTHQSRRGD